MVVQGVAAGLLSREAPSAALARALCTPTELVRDQRDLLPDPVGGRRGPVGGGRSRWLQLRAEGPLPVHSCLFCTPGRNGGSLRGRDAHPRPPAGSRALPVARPPPP